MELKRFLQDEGLVRLSRSIGKNLSYRGVHRLARVIAGVINLKAKGKMRKAIKSNLRVVLKDLKNTDEIEAMSKDVVRNLFRSHADYFHYFEHPQAADAAVTFSENALEMIADIKERKIPTVICGPHHGNFDLFGFSLARQKLPMMVLSVPNPDGVYTAQNAMRNESGMNVVPIDMKAIRDARKFLMEGNCLVTGIDRPVDDVENAKYKPLFFGQPAPLPVFYTRFGLEEGVRVRVACCVRKENGDYYIECSDPIPMKQYDKLNEEYENNAQAVLKVAEDMISQNPDQWLMLYPVWGLN